MSCNFNAKTFDLNQEFNLNKDEIAKIADTNLQIRMIGAGHEISESGGNVYCKIELNYNGETLEREVNLGSSAKYAGLEVKITAVDETAVQKVQIHSLTRIAHF